MDVPTTDSTRTEHAVATVLDSNVPADVKADALSQLLQEPVAPSRSSSAAETKKESEVKSEPKSGQEPIRLSSDDFKQDRSLSVVCIDKRKVLVRRAGGCLYVHRFMERADGGSYQPKHLGHVRCATAWDWEYSPELAVRYVMQQPFVTPKRNMCAVFGKFSEGIARALTLQWVEVPTHESDDMMINCALDSVCTCQDVRELLTITLKNDDPQNDAKITSLLQLLDDKDTECWWVSAAVHSVRNSPLDELRRITLRYKKQLGDGKIAKRGAHIIIFDKKGDSYKSKGNQAKQLVHWVGSRKLTSHYVVSDVLLFDD